VSLDADPGRRPTRFRVAGRTRGSAASREESAVSLFLVLKVVHVLSVVVAVGANVTYAFWLRLAGRDRERLLFAIHGIRWLDRRIANPMYAVVFVTGVLMVLTGAYSFETGWIAASMALFLLVAILGIAVFAPAIRRQLAEAERDPTSPAYAAVAARTARLGLTTTAIVLVIVVLMVAKPF
jgi:uncharacterized membrane protein